MGRFQIHNNSQKLFEANWSGDLELAYERPKKFECIPINEWKQFINYWLTVDKKIISIHVIIMNFFDMISI